MGSVYARGEALADQLNAAGIRATLDPQAVMGLLPCVLVGPPARDATGSYGGDLVAWRLVVLSDTADPARSWLQLDDLLDELAQVIPWERAEPASYVLPSGTDPAPAYDVTYSETVTGD